MTRESTGDPAAPPARETTPEGPDLSGDPLAGERVTVVGGGFGGLATAPMLAELGAEVTVLDRNERVGGVANRIEADGFTFDTGPSWYLMPGVFERYFDFFDREPADYYDLDRLDPHYRIVWKDGDRVDVPDDPAAVAEIFESYEDGAGEAFREYLDEAEFTYEVGMDRFVYEDRPRLRDFADLDVARSARGIALLGSMADHAAGYFEDPKLRQLVQYTLVFLGGAPHNTPALYNLMAHVDFELGVFYPEGGIYSVVEALVELGRERGVDYRTGTTVTAIADRPRGLAVETRPSGDGDGPDGAGGTDRHRADRVVCNANPAHVQRALLGPEYGRGDDYWADRTYAPSAYMLYLGVEGDLESLEHHTLVLPTDWDGHFERIFDDPAWPDDPAYYVNVPSRTDDTVAPDGHETVVVLVPVAPGLDDSPDRRERFRGQVLDDIAEHAGVDLRDRIAVEREACVSEFAERVNAPEGTALGLAHTLFQTGPLRPSHRGEPDGLYYVGGYTTPGIGVPMCLISAEHTAAAVREDAEETRRMPPLW
ncbi:phytoene desaturase family protein [Halosimplex halophilum]|uniref:phytoene desaturase family protein n=1 Tax=Halosimplex halophilum TaxID=2559572 RepID=UPI00107F7677|nr:phytoene desaturase family protein [Halosimplex halophilum]